MNEQNIDAYQVFDPATGEYLEWYGKYVWHDAWFECDEGFETRAEAEQDARAMLAYLETHAPPTTAADACPHAHIQGDNYRAVCLDCGAIVDDELPF